MKVSITELRDMVAEAVRRTLAEAPKKGSKRPPKDIPMVSDETEAEARERRVRGIPGYVQSDVNDFSKPLGPLNTYKRQGASNMGGWTAEAIVRKKIKEMQVRKLVRMIVGEEVQARRGKR
jgi:hypothetical protein